MVTRVAILGTGRQRSAPQADRQQHARRGHRGRRGAADRRRGGRPRPQGGLPGCSPGWCRRSRCVAPGSWTAGMNPRSSPCATSIWRSTRFTGRRRAPHDRPGPRARRRGRGGGRRPRHHRGHHTLSTVPRPARQQRQVPFRERPSRGRSTAGSAPCGGGTLAVAVRGLREAPLVPLTPPGQSTSLPCQGSGRVRSEPLAPEPSTRRPRPRSSVDRAVVS